jgi:hypothetical protein
MACCRRNDYTRPGGFPGQKRAELEGEDAKRLNFKVAMRVKEN